MCFLVHPKYSKPRIAKCDIVCYKIGKNFDDLTECFSSEFQNHEYRLNELQPTVELIPYWDISQNWCIDNGYHSFHPCNYRAQFYKKHTSDNELCLVKCIIPKGSTYYYDPRFQEYVSDRIIAQKVLSSSSPE